jgi:hypothetical protein
LQKRPKSSTSTSVALRCALMGIYAFDISLHFSLSRLQKKLSMQKTIPYHDQCVDGSSDYHRWLPTPP